MVISARTEAMALPDHPAGCGLDAGLLSYISELDALVYSHMFHAGLFMLVYVMLSFSC